MEICPLSECPFSEVSLSHTCLALYLFGYLLGWLMSCRALIKLAQLGSPLADRTLSSLFSQAATMSFSRRSHWTKFWIYRGCKCSVHLMTNMEHYIYSLFARARKYQTYLQSHLLKCEMLHIYLSFASASKCDVRLLHVYTIANEWLTLALPDLSKVSCKLVKYYIYYTEGM